VQVFNNAVGQIPGDPSLVDRLPELLRWATPWMGGVDLIGQGFSLVSQGQPEAGLKIMMTLTPLPVTEPQWTALVTQAQQRYAQLGEIEQASRNEAAQIVLQAAEAHDVIKKAQDDLDTSVKQARLQVTSVTSESSNSLYKADAARNGKESRIVWVVGLGVLAIAASIAVLPLARHYLGLGPTYTPLQQIGIHLTSTAAFGTFAGVLLARARSRDRAAQRAHDLSTAMGTMIVYSNQIVDPAEKQRFMTTMGQVVLQAHLSTASGKAPKDDSTADLLNLANLLKPAMSNATVPSQL